VLVCQERYDKPDEGEDRDSEAESFRCPVFIEDLTRSRPSIAGARLRITDFRLGGVGGRIGVRFRDVMLIDRVMLIVQVMSTIWVMLIVRVLWTDVEKGACGMLGLMHRKSR
jgi:hypothetical protein